MLASRNQHTEAVTLLLECCAQAYLHDNSVLPTLDMAVVERHGDDIVRLLKMSTQCDTV